jgi:pSer/pThr/pTyr-binding forkhead associated (FHA) protein
LGKYSGLRVEFPGEKFRRPNKSFMFAIELEFKEGGIEREIIFVRRPLVVIGSQSDAHVVIEGAPLSKSLLLARHIGRRFRSAFLDESVAAIDEDSLNFYEHERDALIQLDSISLRVFALDMDLMVRSGEAADRAAVRVLRESTSSSHPLFPALVVRSGVSVVFSFAPEFPVLIGRSRDANLRVDSAFISSVHARFGFENGVFWVEDLGSTNGTFKKGARIAGKINLEPAEQVVLGMDLTVAGIVSGDQIVEASSWSALGGEAVPTYPVLVSLSDVVRPGRIALVAGVPLHLGRDPSSELWIGAPHVSRKHAVVELEKGGAVRLINRSSNGLGHGEGVLQADEELSIGGELTVLDFGGGVTVAVCFSKEQESLFRHGREGKRDFIATPTSLDDEGQQIVKSFPDFSRAQGRRFDAGTSWQHRSQRDLSELTRREKRRPAPPERATKVVSIGDRLRGFIGRMGSGKR